MTPKQPATAADHALLDVIGEALGYPVTDDPAWLGRLAAYRHAIEAEAAAPTSGSHGITDPTAPIGWQCGDPDCPQHGLAHGEAEAAAPPSGSLDVDAVRYALAKAAWHERASEFADDFIAAYNEYRLMRERQP